MQAEHRPNCLYKENCGFAGVNTLLCRTLRIIVNHVCPDNVLLPIHPVFYLPLHSHRLFDRIMHYSILLPFVRYESRLPCTMLITSIVYSVYDRSIKDRFVIGLLWIFLDNLKFRSPIWLSYTLTSLHKDTFTVSFASLPLRVVFESQITIL